MRRFHALVVTLLITVLASAGLTAGPAGKASAAAPDIGARLAAIEGMRIISREQLAPDQTFFLLAYRQPIDHHRPRTSGYFEQHLSLLHIGTDRPMVLHTTGYELIPFPFVSEPTVLLTANQLSTEQRYFMASRPDPVNWDYLTIWQAASDHHRLIRALRPIYAEKWVSTGASKGGMTSVYHRRFYPHDVDGTVAYVAPNDVNNARDVYVPFIQRAGDDPACNAALRAFQRTTLKRRTAMRALLQAYVAKRGLTFTNSLQTADRAVEAATLETPFYFWQYNDASLCPAVPTPSSTDRQVFDFIDRVAGWLYYTDQGVEPFVPYYYQASRQLGWTNVSKKTRWLRGLKHYREAAAAPAFTPPSIRPRFERRAMRDIDRWVRRHGSRLLFVYGENDPWSAEPFTLGRGTRDSAVYYQAGGNHGSSIGGLDADEAAAATRRLARWGGVAAQPPSISARSARVVDDTEIRRKTALRP